MLCLLNFINQQLWKVLEQGPFGNFRHNNQSNTLPITAFQPYIGDFPQQHQRVSLYMASCMKMENTLVFSAVGLKCMDEHPKEKQEAMLARTPCLETRTYNLTLLLYSFSTLA
jgi:hypothetical protein